MKYRREDDLLMIEDTQGCKGSIDVKDADSRVASAARGCML